MKTIVSAITEIIIINTVEIFLNSGCLSKHFTCFNSFNHHKTQKGSSYYSILQMKKLWHREVSYLKMLEERRALLLILASLDSETPHRGCCLKRT